MIRLELEFSAEIVKNWYCEKSFIDIGYLVTTNKWGSKYLEKFNKDIQEKWYGYKGYTPFSFF